MALELPNLSCALDALAPHASKETLDYHWGKRHRTYVEKLNGMVEANGLHGKSLEELIRSQSGGVFNNAAQAFNHDFY